MALGTQPLASPGELKTAASVLALQTQLASQLSGSRVHACLLPVLPACMLQRTPRSIVAPDFAPAEAAALMPAPTIPAQVGSSMLGAASGGWQGCAHAGLNGSHAIVWGYP